MGDGCAPLTRMMQVRLPHQRADGPHLGHVEMDVADRKDHVVDNVRGRVPSFAQILHQTTGRHPPAAKRGERVVYRRVVLIRLGDGDHMPGKVWQAELFTFEGADARQPRRIAGQRDMIDIRRSSRRSGIGFAMSPDLALMIKSVACRQTRPQRAGQQRPAKVEIGATQRGGSVVEAGQELIQGLPGVREFCGKQFRRDKTRRSLHRAIGDRFMQADHWPGAARRLGRFELVAFAVIGHTVESGAFASRKKAIGNPFAGRAQHFHVWVDDAQRGRRVADLIKSGHVRLPLPFPEGEAALREIVLRTVVGPRAAGEGGNG